MIKVSDFIIQFIESKGVKHIFMLPGGGAMHLVDSVGKSNVEYICCQHEQAASIAAEAYAQHTNHLGVVLVTSGPGATNAITGITAGWIDSTPMFVISGQAKRADLVGNKNVRQIGSQEVQIIDMVRPITKYAVQILEPNDIKYHLERAYYEAKSGRPGPVWLSIPLDVQAAMVDEESMAAYVPKESKAEDKSDIMEFIVNTVRLLSGAEKPLILAGNGIKLSGATDKFYELLDLLQIPVLTTWKTIDMLGEDEQVYVGHPGIMGDRGANLILQSADLLISIGSRLDTSITAFNESNFGKNAKKIVVDIDENELKRMKMEQVEVKANCDAFHYIDLLCQELKQNERLLRERRAVWTEWLEDCRITRAKYPTVTLEHKNVEGVVSAYYFIELLCRNTKRDDVIVPESSGGAGEITYQAFKPKRGQKMKNAAGLGSMGFGLPYAIGSCLANNRRRTILINGDGAFQLNIQELETLVRLQLPVKIFIWNNSGYASIRAMQKNTFEGNYVASGDTSGLTMPDISRVAQAYGLQTYFVDSNDVLEDKLPKILSGNEPVLCELKISPEETVSPRVKAIRMEDGSMRSTPLEEMWPKEGL